MLRKLLIGLSVCMGCMMAPAAFGAADGESAALKEDAAAARQMLARAVALYKEQGEQAFTAFSGTGEFVHGELYVYGVGTDGTMRVSGGPSSFLVGRKVMNMTDAAGTPFFYDMLEKAKTAPSGQVSYRWLNPVHHKAERKQAYFEKVGDLILAVGFYLPRATPEEAMALLDKAVAAVRADPAAAIEAFNNSAGPYVYDDLYVFALDGESGVFKAHGAKRKMVGTSGGDLQDPEGKPIGQQIISIAKSKGGGEIDYVWPNPVTRKVESKHTVFREVDGLVVCVGYYSR